VVTRRELIIGGSGFAFLSASVLQTRGRRDLAMLKALSIGAASTPTPTPTVDLIVNSGETYSIDTGVTENFRHALNGGTVQNAGTLQMDDTS